MTDERTNTTPEQRPKTEGGITGKGFVKGDPRINRNGRPKSFDKLRALAVTLGNEAATAKGPDGKTAPIVIDDHAVTQIEMLLRTMMRENPARFVEIAFGKVPDKLEITQHDIDGEIKQQLAVLAARSKTSNADDAESTDGGGADSQA